MFFKKKKKVFCIGRNKTGTTSIEQALKSFGYKMGDQPTAELLSKEWGQRDFRNIIKYCKTADAFQDVPFSHAFTYQAVDAAFPGSKFILTLRNSTEEWYNSVIRFQTNIVGKNRLPTANDLSKYPYRYEGWLWEQQQLVYGTTETNVYDKAIYTRHYENHNANVLEYFRHRPQDLLVVNIADPTAMQSLCEFLDIEYTGQEMPHLNQSRK